MHDGQKRQIEWSLKQFDDFMKENHKIATIKSQFYLLSNRINHIIGNRPDLHPLPPHVMNLVKEDCDGKAGDPPKTCLESRITDLEQRLRDETACCESSQRVQQQLQARVADLQAVIDENDAEYELIGRVARLESKLAIANFENERLRGEVVKSLNIQPAEQVEYLRQITKGKQRVTNLESENTRLTTFLDEIVEYVKKYASEFEGAYQIAAAAIRIAGQYKRTVSIKTGE